MYKQPESEHSYSRARMRRELLEKSYHEEAKKRARKKKNNLKKINVFLILAILITAGILVKMWLDTDPFFTPGEVTIDDVDAKYEKIINDNIEKWNNTGNKIRHDIKITQKTVYDMAEAGDNDILVKIELPTVSFYNKELNVTSSEANSDTVKWIDYETITPENRVVSVDNNYFFDDITKGAKYTYLSYETDDAEAITAKWIIAADQKYDEVLPQNAEDFLSFAQTGVTALTRAMTNTLNGKAGGRGSYFADKIKDFLSSKDLTHISNEVSFIDGCKGSRGTMSLCADWRSLDSITAIGTDIVELTGNHNNNYGTDANNKTIDKYHELSIKTFGGGKTEEEASKPLELNEKGNHITLLGYNHSTSTKGNGELANGNKPGANGYTEEKALADIKAAKERGDFILVDIQFAECYSYPDGYTEMPTCDAPIAGQKAFFRKFIDMGADMVIGTQAHHPQTFEYYNGKPIYYGLGNLFFDQTYWPGTQRGYILTHYFKDGKLLNTRISPTWYDESHQVYLTNEATSEKFIERLVNSSSKGN